MTDQELVDFYEATLERIATPTHGMMILHDYNRIVGEAERALEAGRNRVKRKRLWRLF
jgi:hypothetical protein